MYRRVGNRLLDGDNGNEDVFTLIDNDEKVAFGQFLQAFISCRVALLQIFPVLTLWAIFASSVAAYPLFVPPGCKRMQENLLPMIKWDARSTAQSYLGVEGGCMNAPSIMQLTFLTYYLFIFQSRLILFCISGFQTGVAIAIVFAPNQIGPFVRALIAVLIHQGVLISGFIIMLFQKLLFPEVETDENAVYDPSLDKLELAEGQEPAAGTHATVEGNDPQNAPTAENGSGPDKTTMLGSLSERTSKLLKSKSSRSKRFNSMDTGDQELKDLVGNLNMDGKNATNTPKIAVTPEVSYSNKRRVRSTPSMMPTSVDGTSASPPSFSNSSSRFGSFSPNLNSSTSSNGSIERTFSNCDDLSMGRANASTKASTPTPMTNNSSERVIPLKNSLWAQSSALHAASMSDIYSTENNKSQHFRYARGFDVSEDDYEDYGTDGGIAPLSSEPSFMFSRGVNSDPDVSRPSRPSDHRNPNPNPNHAEVDENPAKYSKFTRSYGAEPVSLGSGSRSHIKAAAGGERQKGQFKAFEI